MYAVECGGHLAWYFGTKWPPSEESDDGFDAHPYQFDEDVGDGEAEGIHEERTVHLLGVCVYVCVRRRLYLCG